MRFNDAAKTAARFAGGKKSAPAMQCVRILPAMGNYPPRMFSTDGIVGVFVPVDAGNLPDVLVPAEDLAAVGREKTDVTGLWDETDRLLVQTGSGMYVLRKVDPSLYPPIPPVPDSLELLEEWPTVAKVVHAAGEVPGRPELECVHFHRDRVEASDSTRVALADVLTPIEALAPAAMFKHWPKREHVYASVQNGWVYFRVGQELRMAVSRTGKTLDARQYLEKEHVGAYIVVSSSELLDAVKKAAKVDAIVRFKFGVMAMNVCGRSRDSEKQFYTNVTGEDETRIEGKIGLTGGQKLSYPEFNLDGLRMIDALKAIDTPNLRLCYQEDKTKPLRIESGGYVELIATVLE